MRMVRNWLVVFAVFFLCSCDGHEQMDNTELANKTLFYANISGGKKLPFFPVDPISESSTGDALSYIEVKYDDMGRMINLIKYVKGDVYFIQKITYSGSSIESVVVRDKEGSVIREL